MRLQIRKRRHRNSETRQHEASYISVLHSRGLTRKSGVGGVLALEIFDAGGRKGFARRFFEAGLPQTPLQLQIKAVKAERTALYKKFRAPLNRLKHRKLERRMRRVEIRLRGLEAEQRKAEYKR